MSREKKQVPKEICQWAAQTTIKNVRRTLGCSLDIAHRLHDGIPVFLAPLELEWLEHQYNRMRRLYRARAVPLAITQDRRSRIKHKDVIRMMATFVAQNIDLVMKFKKDHNLTSTFRWQSMYKPLYDFGDMLYNEILPYLLYVWHEYPENRHELFDGTGFPEYVSSRKRKPKPSS